MEGHKKDQDDQGPPSSTSSHTSRLDVGWTHHWPNEIIVVLVGKSKAIIGVSHALESRNKKQGSNQSLALPLRASSKCNWS